MPAQKGSAFLLKISNGSVPAAYQTVAGLRTTQMSVTGDAVVVTSKDSGGWRELLSGGGIKSMSFSGGGTVTDKASLVVFQDALFDGTLRDVEVIVPRVGTFAAEFAVSALELSGEHNADIQFTISLESSGAVTFTVEP